MSVFRYVKKCGMFVRLSVDRMTPLIGPSCKDTVNGYCTGIIGKVVPFNILYASEWLTPLIGPSLKMPLMVIVQVLLGR